VALDVAELGVLGHISSFGCDSKTEDQITVDEE
jgi:hypothetical protein